MDRQSLPNSDAILSKLLDMRVPLTFTLDDCRLIGEIIAESVSDVVAGEDSPEYLESVIQA